MSDDQAQNPDVTPDQSDPGDETARRYRYQWAYAAITCCMLLDDTCDVAEVFCEHHEDVLLKHNDGTFTGLQVKTRASDQPVWKINQPAVRKSFVRFASLESQFPGKFRAFRFLTNHPLYSANNGNDLPYVLGRIKGVSTFSEVSGPSEKFLRRVSKAENCEEDVGFTALAKASAKDDLPKLTDVLSRLIDTLAAVWPAAATCSHDSVMRAALALVEECGRASSLAHEETLPAYIPATTDADDESLIALLNGKKIDKVRLLDVLERGLDETALLDSDPYDLLEPGVGIASLLLKKLNAGGFSEVSLNSAEDLRNKADYLGIKWTKQHGRTSGLQRYGHVRTLVLSDCARAFEASKSKEGLFGINMLDELHARFALRRGDGSQLYGCRAEHLEGFAYSLTSECKVQWSIDRPWEDE